MKQLKRLDFSEKFVGKQDPKPYFSYQEPGLELCLEPHIINGFDVALYDDHQNLLIPKESISFTEGADHAVLDMGMVFEFYDKVLQRASAMLHRYKIKQGKSAYGNHTN